MKLQKELIALGVVGLMLAAGSTVSAQTVSIANASLAEGNASTAAMTFNVTLSAAQPNTVRVRYKTTNMGAVSSPVTTTVNTGGAIAIPSLGSAAPYPSTITTAGIPGLITALTVTLTGLTHTYPADLDILLVGPSGQKVVLMSDAGDSTDITGSFTFSDLAAAKMPNAAIPPGTYRPTDVIPNTSMPTPAPAGPYGNLLSVFNGSAPNGTWNLYIQDHGTNDSGNVASWRLNFTTSTGDYAGQDGALEFLAGVTSAQVVIPVYGDTEPEANEQFVIDLSAIEGPATILDGQALGTITNDDVAGPSRVFVSITGSDANDCSILTTPCKTITGSMQKVAPDGEVIIITGGEYDTAPIGITKGVKINAPTGVVALVRQPIVVNALGQKVVLRGLTLKSNGIGTAVTLANGGTLILENMSIDRWDTGLQIDNPNTAFVSVTGSVFRFNDTGVSDQSAQVGTPVVIDSSRFENGDIGLIIYGSSVVVRETSFSGHSSWGVNVWPGDISLQQCELTGNAVGAYVGPSGTLRIDRTLIHGNTTGITNSGIVQTRGTNSIAGNGTNTTGTAPVVIPGG